MVLDHAESAFVVAHGVRGREVDQDADVGERGNEALGLRETEDVARLVVELELGRQFGVVVDREHPAHRLA